jgi:hypothetical protein
MKKLFLPLLLGATLAISSCSEDFEVAAPYKNVTVVYGILDPLDTAHYIRIYKAFLDENKSAIDMSKVADSSYDPAADLVVTMKTFTDEAGKNQVGGIVTLTQVEMEKEGFVKNFPANEQGFYQAPNKAYKLVMPLDPYRFYRLVIQNVKTGNVDSSGLVKIVNPDSTKGANRFYINSFTKSGYTIDFSKTMLNTPTYSLIGNVPLNGRFVEGMMRFHYQEKNISTNSTVSKYVDYNFAEYNGTSTQFDLKVENKNIYAYLRDAIGVAPANIERYMDSLDFYIYAANEELYTYREVNLAQGGGIAADQIKPYYTNIKGTNALGILGSRTYRSYFNAAISDVTMDSLQQNSLTQQLNIKGRTSN